MSMKRVHGEAQPGIKWGPFTARIPFVHTGVVWPEFLQGVLVSAATGLALVPYMTGALGLSFEEAVWMAMIQAMLISSGPILFGEPFAAGWITPALPLVLGVVLSDAYPTSVDKFHMMTALSIDLAVILLVLGFTGLGRKLIEWLPQALKGAIIMGAAIAAFERILGGNDTVIKLDEMPVTLIIAIGVCLLLAFSIPVAKMKLNMPWLAKLASLGLLPGFLLAGVVGTILGELSYTNAAGESIVKMGIMIPPVAGLMEAASPFSIGFPPIKMFIVGFPLAFMTYIILFGDIVTGIEVLRGAISKRPDEKVEFSSTRTHLSTGIRNVIMSLFAPFFPTQGSLWTGVHVIIVNRWAEGRDKVDSLFSSISSYYFFGLPLLYLVLPLTTGLIPLLPVALVLTLGLTGFACAYVAMEIPRNATERGVVLTGGACIAFLPPLPGLIAALVATLILLGFKDAPNEPQELLHSEPEELT